MAMTLRVVVPPHPLIGHWLTVLRFRDTPQRCMQRLCKSSDAG